MADLRWILDEEAWNSQDDLIKLVQESPQPNEGKLVEYLNSAVMLWATALFHDRILGDPNRAITSTNAYTDGTWIWTNELAHYVSKYHFRLPPEFADHAESRNWTPPTSAELDIEQILVDLYGVVPIDWQASFLVSYPGTNTRLQQMLRANAHQPAEGEARILAYLRAGRPIFEADVEMFDIVESTAKKPLGRLSILTDGRHVWPNVLNYYVERYHYRLDEKLVAEILGTANPSRKYSLAQVRHAVLLDATGDLVCFSKAKLIPLADVG